MTRQDKILAAGLQWSFIHDELKILTSNAFRISQRSDYEHALRSELTRLTRLRQELIDRDVAQSLANGMLRERQLQIQADCVALRAIIQEERQAVDDHEAARRLGGVAAADASTGRARRLINEAINAITQLTSSVTVGVPTRPAQVNTPNSTPGLSDRQGDTSQLFSDNRANPMVRLPTSSLVNAAAIPNAPRGMAASPSNIEHKNSSLQQNTEGEQEKASTAGNQPLTATKRKHVEFEDIIQFPEAKRSCTEDDGQHQLSPHVSSERRLLTPLEAGVGTGGRVFHGSLVQVESANHYDEECKYLNIQTITAVYHLKKWSLEELRLQDYYHGYKYGKAQGVPQSSNKGPFSGFGALFGGLFAGPAAANHKLDSGASIEMMKCIICLEKNIPKHDSITTKCGHVYCRGCIRQLFTRSMSDPELFPPRCCKEAIPYEQVLFLFPGNFKHRFDERLEEFNTPNPIYCPTINCGKFLAPRTFKHDNTASCEKCKENTCTKCRAKAHEQENCPADKDLEELRMVGKESNWQICFNCKNLVELNTGCYHITCRCGAEFCYLCGIPWTENPKACTCIYFDEAHLIARAVEMAAREAGNQRATEAQTNAWAERLRQNPDCRHVTWKNVHVDEDDDVECGLGCGDLNDLDFYFIMECVDCGTWACRQCAFNRNR